MSRNPLPTTNLENEIGGDNPDVVRKPAPAFKRELKLANAICDWHV